MMDNETRQLWARNNAGEIIEVTRGEAELLRGEQPEGYQCLDPHCSVRVRPRGGPKVRDHFYHVSPVNHSGETMEHLMGKAMLHSWAQLNCPQFNVNEEKSIAMSHEDSTASLRRPDVLVEGPEGSSPLALEVEYKRYSLDEWMLKEKDLRLHGVNSAWFFGLSKFSRGNEEGSIYLPQLMEQLVLQGNPTSLYVIDPWEKRIGLFSTHDRLMEDGYADYGYSHWNPPVRKFHVDDLHLVSLDECWLTEEVQFRGPWDYAALEQEQSSREFRYFAVNMKMMS